MSRPAPETYKIILNPGHIEADVTAGQSILEAARGHGVHIASICGGKGTCGKCRVQIDGPVDDPDEIERIHISRDDLEAGVRLACRTKPRSGQTIKTQRGSGGHARILKGGKSRSVVLSPAVRKVHVRANSTADSGETTDWERVSGALGDEPVELSLGPLRRLPEALRTSPHEVTVALRGNRLVSVEPGDTTAEMYGLAFDIGTTTVVGYLMDLNSGRELAAAAQLNPQGAYGEDLITRLSFVREHPDGLTTLRNSIVSLLNRLIEEVIDKSGVSRNGIYEVTLVGNVVMHHLLLGIDPSGLIMPPYAPVVRDSLDIPAQEIGLELGPQAQAHLLPNIAGFVGADMVGALLTALPQQSSGIQLIIDLGTNGEMAMGSRERLLVCSTAAGPAFEGARIRNGMRASTGAIDRVTIDGDAHYHTVDRGAPAGICGSGLVDAVAQMLERGILEPSGRLLRAGQLPPGVGPRLAARIKGAGQPADPLRFVLSAPGAGDGQEVAITQQDVRELQLAKGAICAGIQVLQGELGIGYGDIEQVLLAGAFGTFVSVESARRIGLIPPLPLERVKAIGNAAGLGAQLALLSTAERRIAGTIARRAEHIRLSGRPDFQGLFTRSLAFPTAFP